VRGAKDARTKAQAAGTGAGAAAARLRAASSHAVLRALELDAYRELPAHDSDFLAQETGLERAEVERHLAALVAAGQFRRRGKRYRIERVMTVDTQPDAERNRALKHHWAEFARQRLLEGGDGEQALYSYNLFAISEPAFERIRRLHVEHFERVREIIAQSKRADRVVLMNLQLLPLAREPRHRSALTAGGAGRRKKASD